MRLFRGASDFPGRPGAEWRQVGKLLDVVAKQVLRHEVRQAHPVGEDLHQLPVHHAAADPEPGAEEHAAPIWAHRDHAVSRAWGDWRVRPMAQPHSQAAVSTHRGRAEERSTASPPMTNRVRNRVRFPSRGGGGHDVHGNHRPHIPQQKAHAELEGVGHPVACGHIQPGADQGHAAGGHPNVGGQYRPDGGKQGDAQGQCPGIGPVRLFHGKGSSLGHIPARGGDLALSFPRPGGWGLP